MVIAQSIKVKPMMNNTIKGTDHNWSPGPEPNKIQEVGVPRAIFIPHANSLPFEERHVTLDQPVKIGRYVYKAIPSPNNTVFECRVLSRHHATLSYEKGHFFLVDNESSNGTFINNNRCSITKEQHEVFSGDVVQFGIPVVESTANADKNTFPPVVALLKLYHADGKEAKLPFHPAMTTPLHLKELYQLNNFVQEAIQREASLESRIRTLRECVERTRAEAQTSWELFIGEQRLLMRVHTLETMLSTGKMPEAKHLATLLSDKRNYQEVAQESLRAAHEQRLALEEALERRAREAAALHQSNCSLRQAHNNATNELQKLAARCDRKMCAARLAITAAEEREQAALSKLPLACSVQNGEAKMLVLSTDSNKLAEAKRSGTLEDAVRALPDYIKLLLPQNVLNKVGIKSVIVDEKAAKEYGLILKKNNHYNADGKEKRAEENEAIDSGSGEKPDGSCTDDEKLRLNHDGTDFQENPVTSEGEFCADNNANSTYKENNIEESPSKVGVEYANVLRVMSGLNDEIKLLRERLCAMSAENDQLKNIRDELLSAQIEIKDEPSEETAVYKARIADLEVQVNRLSSLQESHVTETSRLNSRILELQSELATRPTCADLDALASALAVAHRDLRESEISLQVLNEKLNTPKQSFDKATSISTENLDEKIDISANIDEMFRLDDDYEDETESVVTETLADDPGQQLEREYVKLDDDERLRVTMSNGSLHALEEELVRAKERWAEVSAEKAQLLAQLAALQTKRGYRVDMIHGLAIMLPVLAAYAFYVMLPYIS